MSVVQDALGKHLLDINMPRDQSVPLEVYIAFPESLHNKDAKETVRKQWLYGNDQQVTAMDLMFSQTLSAIFRPSGILIDWVNITVTILTPSGLQLQIPSTVLSKLGNSTEEKVANLNDYMYVKFHKDKEFLTSDLIIPLRGKISEDIAKELLESKQYSPLELLILGLGYKPIREIKRLFIPRIVSWFKGFDGKPMHVAQFTLPESGKTSFGLRSETLFNWRYIPELPSLARLILDGRTGIRGEVFLRNGLTFDEFDKWTIASEDRRSTFDSILTGMEQGKWERGISTMRANVPEVPRLIPILFFGNLGDFGKLYGMVQYNTRAFYNTIYTNRLGHDVRALCDRLAIVDACFTQIRIMDYLTYKVLPDSVLRGIVSILQKEVKPCDVSQLKGRLKRHADNLYAILTVMLKDVTVETVDGMVSGSLDWDKKFLTQEPALPEPVPARDGIPEMKWRI